ncbi:hypothetical protein BKA65DRAFT_521423 [Rhexocercosporidium sp. MPI-PUGE-AT-0058]|nr:hypothetical protein BKA65DRAFT_521423 [Rhexocercosporidium sp. MPI-PUGE-AT-0058]
MALFRKKETGFQGFRDPLLAGQKEKDKESEQQFDGDASRLELLARELRPPQTDLTLFEKHEADIASLTKSLTELLLSRKDELTVDHERPESLGKETVEPSGSQPLSCKRVFAPARTSGGSAPALRPVPTSQHGLPNYNSGFFPVQSRIFFDRNEHHINYPVIPRWQDRARLRRIQKESPELLPDDLPPWSVRDQVPTVPQPD